MEGKQFFLVMNNIANKILKVVYAVIKNQKEFDPNYMSADPRFSE